MSGPKIYELPAGHLDWTEQFQMTESEAAAIADPEWIVPNLVVRGHLIFIPAEPNGGKTTIFWHLAKGMTKDGYSVNYVNADVAGADAKKFVQEAKESGVSLLLPDMKRGLSMQDVVTHLIDMNRNGGDFSGYVFIFDTLKKMTSVINKTASAELYKVLRGLTAKGMTVICLAHTNKYPGEDGKPVFEGTGDMRSDCDEMIYLIPQKHDDGSLTVSTKPDKVRGSFVPITFEITPEREVQQTEYVDVAEQNRQQALLEIDQPTIEAISAAIQRGHQKQGEIIVACKNNGISKRTVQAVLKRYTKGPIRIWDAERQEKNNAICYRPRQSAPGVQSENPTD